MTHQEISDFLLGKTTFKGLTASNYDHLIRYSRGFYKNSELAQDAVSYLVEKLYLRPPSFITFPYCVTIIRNYSWFCNSNKISEANNVFLEDKHYTELPELISSNDYDEIFSRDFATFYGQELYKEGVYTRESILLLEKIRSVVNNLDYVKRSLYEQYWVKNMTQKEIADYLGVPRSSVQKRIFSLKKYIQQRVKNFDSTKLVY